jgi:hypothetical protein
VQQLFHTEKRSRLPHRSRKYILYRSLSILKLSNIFIFLQEVH